MQGLKAVELVIIARDDDEAHAIFNDLAGCRAVTEYPVFAIGVRDSLSKNERDWFASEYPDDGEGEAV